VLILKVVKGSGEGQVLTIPAGETVTFGRSAVASFPLDDPMLSREHSAIEYRNGVVAIRDLASRNGTFVNGKLIERTPKLLKVGDRIKIGSVVMELAEPVAPKPRSPSAPPIPGSGGHAAAPPPPASPSPALLFPETPTPVNVPVYAIGTPPAAPAEQPTPPKPSPRKTRRGPKVTFTLPPPAPPAPPLPAKPAAPAARKPELPRIEGFTILGIAAMTPTGPIYKAEQTLMQRTCLLKAFMGGTSDDGRVRRRLLREARSRSKLAHPSIVELYDVNEQDKLMYLVLELIEGETLQQMVHGHGPIPPPRALRYMLQTAEALQYAHEQQVIHRDIRPSTIIVRREDDRAKLFDFSLARGTEPSDASVVTAVGEGHGLSYFTAPEQARDPTAVDVRTDIYSFATTFFYALSGRYPFEAKNVIEFEAKIKIKVPPLEGLPAGLSALLERAMEKDPDARYQDMTAFLADLRPLATISVGE
jgi:tRNA A-37 threonylcarbamoyl transferase component Bud32